MNETLLFDALPIAARPPEKPVEKPEDKTAPAYTIIVPGDPVAKGRARHFIRHGRVMIYTPKETQDYEQKIKNCVFNKYGAITPHDDCAIGITVRAYVGVPASYSQKRRASALVDDIRPLSRPDCDNYLKIVCDALNGLLYRDDSLITDMLVSKRYSENPRMEIEVYL